MRDGLSDVLDVMRQRTLANAARGVLFTLDIENRPAQHLREGIAADAATYEEISDDKRAARSEYALTLALADELADDNYRDPRRPKE